MEFWLWVCVKLNVGQNKGEYTRHTVSLSPKRLELQRILNYQNFHLEEYLNVNCNQREGDLASLRFYNISAKHSITLYINFHRRDFFNNFMLFPSIILFYLGGKFFFDDNRMQKNAVYTTHRSFHSDQKNKHIMCWCLYQQYNISPYQIAPESCSSY